VCELELGWWSAEVMMSGVLVIEVSASACLLPPSYSYRNRKGLLLLVLVCVTV
jgi:hypothetical protein